MQTAMQPHPEVPGATLTWSPQSDLRNCAVPALSRVIGDFGAAAGEPWMADLLARLGIAHGDLGAALFALSSGLKQALLNPELELPEALAASGFLDLDQAVQDAVFARLGRNLLAASIWSTRMTNPAEGPVSYAKALADLLAATSEAAAAFEAYPSRETTP